MFKWRKELESGQYYNLLSRGFFDNRPDDHEPTIAGLDFYMDAFWELHSCRPVGLEIQAIPFTAIVEYFRIYGTGDFDEFLYLMRALDRLYLKLNAEASEKTQGAKVGNQNGNKSNTNNRKHKG